MNCSNTANETENSPRKFLKNIRAYIHFEDSYKDAISEHKTYKQNFTADCNSISDPQVCASPLVHQSFQTFDSLSINQIFPRQAPAALMR